MTARWLFVRVSGALLVVLLGGHVLMLHVMRDASTLDHAFFVERWRSPVWRTWDAGVLLLGLLHGAEGLRHVVADHVADPARRLALGTALAVVTGAAVLLVLVTVAAVDLPA